SGHSRDGISNIREGIVNKLFACVLIVLLFCVSALAAEQPKKTDPASISQEDVLKAVREDMQGSRADIMAKNLSLTADQAAKFWPVFQQYQKEQNVIMDEQLMGIQKFVNSYSSLDDAAALALMNAHFDRDAKMNALRQKWLAEF